MSSLFDDILASRQVVWSDVQCNIAINPSGVLGLSFYSDLSYLVVLCSIKV